MQTPDPQSDLEATRAKVRALLTRARKTQSLSRAGRGGGGPDCRLIRLAKKTQCKRQMSEAEIDAEWDRQQLQRRRLG